METMNQQLEKIYQKKQKTRQVLTDIRNKCVAIIYDGFVHSRPIKDIHKDLYKATINEKKVDSLFIYNNSKKLLSKIDKAVDKENAIMFVSDITGKKETQASALAYLFLINFNRNDGTKIIDIGITDTLDKQEGKDKDGMIQDIINYSRDNSMIFYLASEHEDSASDHRDWQGKIYVDEKWKSYTNNPKVERYIQHYHIKTLQWVISKPVWFITRPNCRHYVKIIETEEVLTNTVTMLINKYNMHRKVGQRGGMQTLSHPKSASWYADKKNIEAIIEKYKQRLKLHETMYAKFKSEKLKSMILKDKILIKKWTEYMNEKFS